MNHNLELPNRENKPRSSGLTILLDNGLPINLFIDYVNNGEESIDFVKFGWGTSIISKNINEKISILKERNIHYFFGGTLFEKYCYQNKISDFLKYCESFDCEFIEISNGTISLSNSEKAKYISQFSNHFNVISEIGYKDQIKSNTLSINQWIEFIKEDLNAGSYKVITEARESGTSGICNEKGEVKGDIIRSIIDNNIPLDKMIFEAPNKNLQYYFISKFGPNVNLANIPFQEVISLETLRLGLRSDTLTLFEKNPIIL